MVIHYYFDFKPRSSLPLPAFNHLVLSILGICLTPKQFIPSKERIPGSVSREMRDPPYRHIVKSKQIAETATSSEFRIAECNGLIGLKHYPSRHVGSHSAMPHGISDTRYLLCATPETQYLDEGGLRWTPGTEIGLEIRRVEGFFVPTFPSDCSSLRSTRSSDDKCGDILLYARPDL